MVKIAVISDLHLGFGKGTEREDDPFVAAERAFGKASEEDVDMIVLVGDIFDSRLPRPEHWSRFMKMLSSLKDGKSAEVTRMEGREDVPEEAMRGVPVLAIHGTHERRGKGKKNSVKALEDAGFLVHLHCSSVELDFGGEKVAVHGMSGVPEKYSKKVLEKWSPEPFDGSYNVFMIHQDLEQYIYNPANPPDLGLEDLPQGFDLYVSGHIHWKEETEIMERPFLIPGSLIPTQLKKREAEASKGFYVVDTDKEETEFVEVEPPREFVYEEIEVDGEDLKEVQEKVEKRLEEALDKEYGEGPLIRLKVKGRLPKGVSTSDVDFSGARGKYGDEAIVSISENLEEEGVKAKVQTLRDMREEKLSVDEMGMEILREGLEEADVSINPSMVFEDLVEGKVEEVMERLEEMDFEDKDGEEDGDSEGEGEEVEKNEERDKSSAGGGKDVDEWWKK